MKFSVVLPPQLRTSADPAWVTDFAQMVEGLGFDEISVVEHVVAVRDTRSAYPYSPDGRSPLSDDCPLPDPLELLAFVAGRTTTLGLATGVLVLPAHHPVVLAKRLATLDRLSAGRLRICLGVGWMQEEVEACGGDFQARGRNADEAITLMRALWAGTGSGGVDFEGTTYRVHGAHSWPKPIRPEGVPLYIGGHSPAAARRAGRLGDGFQPLGLGGADLARALDAMRAAAQEAGRDPGEIALALGSTLDRVDADRISRAEARGAARLLLSASATTDTTASLFSQVRTAATRIGLNT